MKHRYLLLMTISSILHTPPSIHALSPEERADVDAMFSQQNAEIKVIRKDAKDVFCALDATLDTASPAAKEKADDIALRPSGLSAANTVAEFKAKITRTGPGPAGVTAEVAPTNPDAVKVLVGLLAGLGVHTRDIMGDSGTGYLSPEELAALIPGIDVDAYARDGKRVESIWDWARVETLSLLETKPAVFKPSAARVKALLERDREYAKIYLGKRYLFKSEEAREDFLNQLIPPFEGDESCPQKGAFISSIFFVQLLKDDPIERKAFIQNVVDVMLPPAGVGVDKFVFSDGHTAEIDLNYYILKEAFRSVRALR
jgi:hypothetical protein